MSVSEKASERTPISPVHVSITPPGTAEIPGLLKQYGCGTIPFAGTDNGLFDRHLLFDNVIDLKSAGPREKFEAFARSIRDILSQRWVHTEQTYDRANPKRVYYLSMEFLIGRSLSNNVSNLLLPSLAAQAASDKRIDLIELLEEEPDAGLGNGGLGRLAACFIESMATMRLPAMGYGLRYEYGIFRQTLEDGWQHEQPDNWLRRPDPWEVVRVHESVEIKLNCSFELRGGSLRAIPDRPSSLIGIPYDRPVVGYGGKTINTLRLWSAAAPDYFDFQRFSSGDFVGALAETLSAESLTRVLYPDDSTVVGQGLRFVQEYFLVACSLADLIRRFRRSNTGWSALPEKAAIQLNDTHPTLAVPELMRILLDDARLGWDEAWDLTQKTLAYTNHTLLPEALEKWPLEWFAMMLPRHLEIIYEINRRFMDEVRSRYAGDNARAARMSLIEDGRERKIRMAHLAIVGSHSTNGVAAIHSELLRKMTVRDFAEMYPERFNNKTNGVTPRRWLLLCNPALSSTITHAIGDGWITHLDQLGKLKPLAGDRNFRDSIARAKRQAKAQFADWLKSTSGQIVDPDTIFDCQVKRIHEYKRQLLNALRIVVLYNRLRENPNLDMPPRTFFFAGKAAPAYHLAKVIIKFINALAGTIDGDPAMRRRMKVVFLPDYRVTVAEHLIPASDVSNQISTAGYEASGTSNMKFMMNGALTLGTRDGATIEMAEEAGEENFFLFGLTAQQVADSGAWYNPHWHYDHEAETRAALDLVFSNDFSRNEPGVFEPLRNTLLNGGDHYMHLADLTSYIEADAQLTKLYRNGDEWSRKAILNIAGSGKFSSDRTIAEYAEHIWRASPVQEELPSTRLIQVRRAGFTERRINRETMTPLRSGFEQKLGWIILALVLGGGLLVLLPFTSALLWAVVLSFSTWPLYRRLSNLLGGRRTLAAFLMTLAMFCIILLPFVVVGITMEDNVRDLATATRHWMENGPPQPPAWLVKLPAVGPKLGEYWGNIAADSSTLIQAGKRIIEPLSGWLFKVAVALGHGLFDLALSILIAFFLFRDGSVAAKRLANALERVAGERGTFLLELAGNTVRGVVYGILGTAFVQAVMAGIGFLIAGVPGAGFLGLLTFFLSVVPVGPPLIWFPAALWLFHQGSTGWGIFMLIWGVGISSVDNIVKPWLISQGSAMPFLLIFFGVLGGALTFGFIGVFIGPTLLAVGYRLVEEWGSARLAVDTGLADSIDVESGEGT